MDNNQEHPLAPSHTPETVQLGAVQETLLIPLYLRAVESRRDDAICRDTKAMEIVDTLDYDFKKFDSWLIQLDVAIRTELFDSAVKRFIDEHTDAVIVNLGAGLDARFFRVDNGQILWFDLDMPDSIALRRRFFKESERNRFIAQSITNPEWLDIVDPYRGDRGVLLVAEGLFCYLEPQDIQDTFRRVATRWPGTEVLFQSISPELVNQQHIVEAVNATQAVFTWGIRSGKEIERWSEDYEFLEEWAFIDYHRKRWGPLRWRTALFPWVYRRLHDVMKISRVRLGKPVSRELR